MQKIMKWVDKEIEQLDLIIEGKAVDTAPEDTPEALKATLGMVQESTPENID